MNDLFPSPSFAPVGPPPGGLAAAFGTARTRRQRSAAVTGTAGLVGCVVLLALLGGSTPHVLVQQPAPPATSVVAPAPVAPAQVTLVDPVSPAGPGVAAPARKATTSTVAAAPATAPLGIQALAGGGTGRTATRPAVSGPMTVSTQTAVPANGQDPTCPVSRPEQGKNSLCGQATAYAGTPSALMGLQVCNMGTSLNQLTFDTTLETDVVVSLKGKTLWRWSTGRRFGDDTHSIPVDVGNCLQWTTDWHHVDQGGRTLPGGTYDVTVSSMAAELASSHTFTTTITF